MGAKTAQADRLVGNPRRSGLVGITSRDGKIVMIGHCLFLMLLDDCHKIITKMNLKVVTIMLRAKSPLMLMTYQSEMVRKDVAGITINRVGGAKHSFLVAAGGQN